MLAKIHLIPQNWSTNRKRETDSKELKNEEKLKESRFRTKTPKASNPP